jgi:hypothetical protein
VERKRLAITNAQAFNTEVIVCAVSFIVRTNVFFSTDYVISIALALVDYEFAKAGGLN